MPLEGLEEEGLPKNPDLSLAQLKFLLTVEDVDKEATWSQLLTAIKENAMAPFYHATCVELKITEDAKLLEELSEKNRVELSRLDHNIEDAQENLGETELKDALLERAEYLSRIGDKEEAVKALRKTFEKTIALGHRIDILFHLIRIGLFYKDHNLVKANVEKAKHLIEEGGDWDRRNRLKVYEGLYAMSIRDFKTASKNFFDTAATFTSYELMSFDDFVKYAVLSCLVAMDRNELKTNVIEGSEVQEALHSQSELNTLVRSLYECHYDQFFISLVWAEEQLKKDYYLAPHTQYYLREMRIIAYTQQLASYQSLSLQHMAQAFGVSEEFIDR